MSCKKLLSREIILISKTKKLKVVSNFFYLFLDHKRFYKKFTGSTALLISLPPINILRWSRKWLLQFFFKKSLINLFKYLYKSMTFTWITIFLAESLEWGYSKERQVIRLNTEDSFQCNGLGFIMVFIKTDQ